MEIPIEHKEKIFLQYWGKCFRVEGINDGSNYEIDIECLHSLKGLEFEGAAILVRSIATLTKEEAISSGWKQVMSFDDFKDIPAKYPRPLMAYQKLIMLGIALPYLEYSVEDLVKGGVYKLI